MATKRVKYVILKRKILSDNEFGKWEEEKEYYSLQELAVKRYKFLKLINREKLICGKNITDLYQYKLVKYFTS